MSEPLQFTNRDEFRTWLKDHVDNEGVWLRFGKTAKVKTLKAGEALEEALCFGWIDGVMKKVDEDSYIKYFAPRRPGSKWSVKNKELVAKLTEQGLMTEAGRVKIAEAQKNGQWDAAKKPSDIAPEQIAMVAGLLADNELAHTNFMNMSASVQKTYTRAYLDAKTDAGREKRLAWMMERLEQNLKPM